MAPGCVSKMQEASSELPTFNTKHSEEVFLDQIPLPSTPPPLPHSEDASPTKIAFDTLDSFEVLEQTVRKQKRLARKKNTDMRMKVLLKRTFDLVCDIMDHENGFDEETKSSPPPTFLPPVVDDLLLYKDLEVNVKHNDYADDEYSASAFSSSSIVPSSDEDEDDEEVDNKLKRKHRDEDNDEDEDEEEDDDYEEENRTAPTNGGRKSKRQKFTSEHDDDDVGGKSVADDDNNNDENESMFGDDRGGLSLCSSCEPSFLNNLTNVDHSGKRHHQRQQHQNSFDDKHQKTVAATHESSNNNSDSEL